MFNRIKTTTRTLFVVAIEKALKGFCDNVLTLGYSLPNEDGTQGARWSVMGYKGLYRVRSTKQRFGLVYGDCMTQVHFGRVSIYVEHGKGRPLHISWAWQRIVEPVAKVVLNLV